MVAQRLYFDHAATTPLRANVTSHILERMSAGEYNPSSQHAEGRSARAALDEARASVARLLGAKPREIVFTGGGSEGDALAILGSARARAADAGHAITAATEHHAVLHAIERLRDEGWTVTILPVDGDGAIDPQAFAAAIRPDTYLASIMLANNELGTIAPIRELARIARSRGVTFHCDAVQAAGKVPLDVSDLGVDLLSLSAHKFYGPKGTGVLYVRTGTPLASLIPGGGQEAGLRAGTESVAMICGLAKAFELAEAERPTEMARLRHLRDRLERDVLARIPSARVNAAGAPRLPHLSSFAFEGVDAPTLLIALDLAGFALSAGSACAAGATEPSHVLAALGGPSWVGRGTLRISLGMSSTESGLDRLIAALERAVSMEREADADLGTADTGGAIISHPEVYS